MSRIWCSGNWVTSFLVLYLFLVFVVHGLSLPCSYDYSLMSRVSLSEEFLEQYETEEDPFNWIVVYDFIGLKPNPHFWKNLSKMMALSSVRRLQYSVLIAEKEGDARAAARLADYYGADTAVFRCERFGRGV